MIKRKQGITVAMVVTMVLVIMLLTTTITISVSSTLKSSRLRAFATELSNIQDTIDTYVRTTSSVDYVLNDVVVTPPTEILTTQFRGETVTDGTVILHVIDLEKIGIEKSVYGKSKTANDVYAVSFETGKVYYVKGYDASNVVYYTLTEDLENLLSGEQGNDVTSNNVIFVPSIIGWSKNPIQVLVKVPSTIDISTVNITTNVASVTISTAVLNGSYNEITVNAGNYAGNYTITVTYILQGESKTQTYDVSTYDSTVPTITVGDVLNDNDNEAYKYLNDVVAIDTGKLKRVMYAELELTAEEALRYFVNNGNVVSNNRIRLKDDTEKYTIYAEDFAGNVAVLVVEKPPIEIPKGFTMSIYGGEKTIADGLVIYKTDAKTLATYSQEEAQKTFDQFVWVPVEYTKTNTDTNSNGTDDGFDAVFKTTEWSNNAPTGSISSDYTEPYSDGYNTEKAEYDAMRKSVEHYGGFYIGRYEAGDGDAKEARSTYTTGANTVVLRKQAYVYNYVGWGKNMSDVTSDVSSAKGKGAVYLSSNMYETNASYTTHLIYGVQWDATLRWLSDKYNVTDSRTWGNYSDSKDAAATNSGNNNINYTTGRNEAWKAKNIYDLAGNFYEWTMEANSSNYRVYRGGHYHLYGSSSPASDRYFSDPSSVTYVDGFRPVLYINI